MIKHTELRTTPENEHSPPTLTKVQLFMLLNLLRRIPHISRMRFMDPQLARSNWTDL